MLKEKKKKAKYIQWRPYLYLKKIWEIAAEVSFVWFLGWLYNHLYNIWNHMQVKDLKRVIQFVKVKIHPESSTEYQTGTYLLIIHQIEHYNVNVVCQLILQVMKLSVSKKSFFFLYLGRLFFISGLWLLHLSPGNGEQPIFSSLWWNLG